ncbi:MAG: nucleotide sugar dehydrogenase [Candidatus Eremiobacteraeota bacterium]|nr:nucleotide sugar dehydrogenase [Candidatus Eremiobacteraeota bacterium]
MQGTDTTLIEELKRKIASKEAVVSVIGAGYVGLPLALGYARKGFKVTAIDDNAEKVKLLSEGVNYITPEEDLKEPVAAGNLKATTDYGVLRKSDIITICVPTPLTKHKEPDISYVVAVTEQIKKYLRPGHLVVLESTTYPGTTEEVILPRLASTGLTVGKDFFLAFSPERVDPGNPTYNTYNTPKIIGGVSAACTELTKLLYEQIIEVVHTTKSPKEAEMVKLLENIFRCVNIALVNEMALLCKKMGIDIWEVIEKASTKPFGFMAFQPGPGLGGHCIPIDPFYLTWKAREYDFHTKFIELAGEINDQMPYHIVLMTIDALASKGKVMKGAKILLLGAAYKKDIDDHRESPSLKIINLLEERGALVEYNDEFIPRIKVKSGTKHSVPWKDPGGYDCVIVATDHSYYDYGHVVEKARAVVDTRNATGQRGNPKVFIL